MHWIDLVIVGVVAWVTFAAFSRGLIREVVTVVALLLGVVLAGAFYGELADDIDFLIDDLGTRRLVAFIAIFGGVFIAGQIGAMLLRRTAYLLMLGPLDHFGGAAFGFIKGLLLVEVVLFALATFQVNDAIDTALEDSALAPIFLDGIPVLLRLLPDEFERGVEDVASFDLGDLLGGGP